MRFFACGIGRGLYFRTGSSLRLELPGRVRAGGESNGTDAQHIDPSDGRARRVSSARTVGQVRIPVGAHRQTGVSAILGAESGARKTPATPDAEAETRARGRYAPFGDALFQSGNISRATAVLRVFGEFCVEGGRRT